ncbi:MAG: hypothetical protein M3P34_07980 [Actinomycetota bacterium]|nr:hypothetical protein [Actinomycetota bacterium]
MAPGAWQIRLTFYDDADDVEDEEASIPSHFEPGIVTVTFPKAGVAEIVRGLRAHNDGYREPPAPIDWSTVELRD